jgi:hypothetical protein
MPIKIYLLDNCYDCPMRGWSGDKRKVCCITGANVEGYDSDFMNVPTFPVDCPLKDYIEVKDDQG